ncbi:hypothetical protein [Pseudoalteromonas luteoviolacea]|uniref:Uncharacterized protein n=1 Tax=Pseudoalteromonas luteoviolacea S4054 TaxID=1129367 RepID=A0A0F6ADD0_9GAMM|nr:hypothetical protein [Pseudoalteromonas luteoviolacea]AOT08613.1 hypothetical protein S4054249_12450 [Pseudoalteromonas luteoviolacea]AOT13529.1 hypothetical protein S40542_12425 [Pseudoalteromonas luteoviolacea]AOT18442.1 hypothetical protein S4054_12425 [Pseudoalteromonas luteoviolacea]KKE83389.1 hypothetical protein N479_13540 [Pseudoalteromonas luteoviolacea S4054]KZN75826.1 hypothetical protein N481_05635 [Pseudoalteromonas luteoviolacea S4047-1]
MLNNWCKLTLFITSFCFFLGGAQAANETSKPNLKYEFELQVGTEALYKVKMTLKDEQPADITYYDEKNRPIYRVILNVDYEQSIKRGKESTIKHSIQKYKNNDWVELFSPEMTYLVGLPGKLEIYNEDMVRMSLNGELTIADSTHL